MIYRDIPGYCDFHEYYTEIFYKLPYNANIVEVGVYLGHSVAFMATLAKETGKNITINAVDTFEGSKEHKKRNFLNEFTFNIIECGLKDYITINIGSSVEASNLFEDKSIDFCFIDASHDYENVKKDILAWSPKVKGILAGHDYSKTWPGVVKAVDEIYPNSKKIKSVWQTELI